MTWSSWAKRTFLSNWKSLKFASGGSEEEGEVNDKDMVDVLLLPIDCITFH